jgi:hypothetical protein
MVRLEERDRYWVLWLYTKEVPYGTHYAKVAPFGTRQATSSAAEPIPSI